jgi:hypothetical protein
MPAGKCGVLTGGSYALTPFAFIPSNPLSDYVFWAKSRPPLQILRTAAPEGIYVISSYRTLFVYGDL